MLTVDHVHARQRGGKLELSALSSADRQRALALAEAYLELAHSHVSRTRQHLYEAWAPLELSARKRHVALGIRKLIDDACVFETEQALDSVDVRQRVFRLSAELRRSRPLAPHTAAFDRSAVVRRVAEDLGCDSETIETALFADLRGQHVLHHAPCLTAASVVHAFELGQAQAVLLRAVRVRCEVRRASPLKIRDFFRKLKFHRLLFRVTKPPETDKPLAGFEIVLDGPFSLFESVTKYGLQFALLLPAIRSFEEWILDAEVRWGKERAELGFHIDNQSHGSSTEASAQPESAEPTRPADISDDARILLEDIEAVIARQHDSPWRVEIAQTILEHRGFGVCVPDLVLWHQESKNPIYIEVLGFWSRDTVWNRIELAQHGLDARVVFCANAKLRVSAEALSDDVPAALYVFKGKPRAKALFECVDKVRKAAHT